MASDIALILIKNFLDSVEETKQGLSSVLTGELNELTKELTEKDEDKFWSRPPNESLSYCYSLEHALAECTAYKLQTTSLKRTFSPFSRHDPQQDLKNQLSKIKTDLMKIKAEKVKANSSLSSRTAPTFPTGRCTSYYHESPKAPSYTLGIRKDQQKKMVELLISASDGFEAIGISGMCGTGKTTLVKQVLKDQRLQGKYAKPICVCLSDLTSEEEIYIRIVKQMLACLNDDTDLLTQETNDESLVKRLLGKLTAQKLKYLIVLDDVWHCSDWLRDLWKRSIRQDLANHPGGALIVTSRLRKVAAQFAQGRNLVHLEPLDKENMKIIVEHLSKSKRTLDDIVYHCHGLPLVAKTLLE